MRRGLLISLLALLLGAIAIWFVQQDQGYIIVNLGDTIVEMSFWMGALLYSLSVGILLCLFLSLRWLMDAGGIRLWWAARRNAKQASKTASGLLLFLDGAWQMSSKLLSQSAANSSMPEVNLLFAARAAGKNRQWDQCQQLLEQLKRDYPEAAVRADLAWAEILVEDLKFAQAQEIVLKLNKEHSDNKSVLKLLSSIYCHQRNWGALNKILPLLKKQQVLEKQALQSLQIQVHGGLLQTFAANPPNTDQENQLEALWSPIPRALRQVPEILIAYVDALVVIDCSDKALTFLLRGIRSYWHTDLITRFGLLEVKDGKKQLASAEKWLEEHADDPQLLMALGLICRRMGFFGKARDYLAATIALAPSAQAYFDLATVHGEMGDDSARLEIYQKGLEFAMASQLDA